MAERCWRSDVIVLLDTPIDRVVICQQVVEDINAYIRGEAINRIDSRGRPGGIHSAPQAYSEPGCFTMRLLRKERARG